MSEATPAKPVTAGQPLEPAQLRRWLTSPSAPRVLDVRTPAEFETVHLPGSDNVPLDTLREHREQIANNLDQDVVLLCRSGTRAEQAQRTLAEIGLAHVHVLHGGITRWEADGGTVVRGRQRWDLERQVRLVAGSLVLAGGLGSLALPGLQWLATAVGGGLVIAALTDTCAMGAALQKLPFNRSAPACDLDTVIDRLAQPATEG